MNTTTPIPDTQERLNDYEVRLFWRAIELSVECADLRTVADASGLPRDKAAYVIKWHEFRDAVIEYREAVNICNLYEKSTKNE